jgi:hypothetical protein
MHPVLENLIAGEIEALRARCLELESLRDSLKEQKIEVDIARRCAEAERESEKRRADKVARELETERQSFARMRAARDSAWRARDKAVDDCEKARTGLLRVFKAAHEDDASLHAVRAELDTVVLDELKLMARAEKWTATPTEAEVPNDAPGGAA